MMPAQLKGHNASSKANFAERNQFRINLGNLIV